MSLYAKFLVAAGGALATAATVLADGKLSVHDGVLIAEAAVAAALVYAVPNKPKGA